MNPEFKINGESSNGCISIACIGEEQIGKSTFNNALAGTKFAVGNT
jgi:GTPase Era involved in 16S rRNA processing